jgi:type IV secretory pathway VirB3-like protein
LLARAAGVAVDLAVFAVVLVGLAVVLAVFDVILAVLAVVVECGLAAELKEEGRMDGLVIFATCVRVMKRHISMRVYRD